MMRSLFVAASAAALLSACSQQAPDKPSQSTPEAALDAASAPVAAPTALGLTVAQLEAADIISPTGVDLGDVQRVDVDASGAVTGLIVEPKGDGPRWVRIPLEGLTTRKEGDDFDLVADMTLEQLKAMPAWVP